MTAFTEEILPLNKSYFTGFINYYSLKVPCALPNMEAAAVIVAVVVVETEEKDAVV